MVFYKLLFLCLFLAVGVEATPTPELDRLVRENNLLKSEHQLAKTPQVYVLFDLVEKKILVKARGTVLKELSIDSFGIWGKLIQVKPLSLLKKDALIKPERKEIKPNKDDEETTSELEVLQVGEMPARYRLSLDEHIWLYVRPKAEGTLSTLLNVLSSLKSYLIIKPMGTLWHALRGESFTEIVLYLSENDARSLYWAFEEGYGCVIRSE
jgi:hypothetical protein